MKKKHSIDFLFSLSLFMVFVICAFLVLLLQTNGYHHIVVKSEELTSIQTPIAYIRTQIRTNDMQGGIEIFQQDHVQGLKIIDSDTKSITYIYKQGKQLMELRILETLTPDFTTGVALFDIEEFEVRIENKQLYVTFQDAFEQKQDAVIQINSD